MQRYPASPVAIRKRRNGAKSRHEAGQMEPTRLYAQMADVDGFVLAASSSVSDARKTSPATAHHLEAPAIRM